MSEPRIAIVELKQETNTFSPLSTTLAAFENEGYLLRGNAIRQRLAGTNTEIGGFLARCEELGLRAEPLFAAWALSGGKLRRSAHQALERELLSGFLDSAPFDGILVSLHGALVAEDCDDVEGTFLESLREIVGDEIPIVCTLDMHGNLTESIVENVSAVVPYHTNPHTDMGACGRIAVDIVAAILLEGISTSVVMKKLPLVIPPENSATTEVLMKAIFDEIDRVEQDPDILTAGVFPVQPWLDIEGLGSAVVVTSVVEAERKAKRYCRDIAEAFWTRRHEFMPELLNIDRALAVARDTDGLCVLANSADSTGSGSPGDATDILSELLAAELDRPALVPVVDPEAVEFAWQCGEGGEFDFQVGGKMDYVFNEPVKLRGRVKKLAEPSFHIEGTAFSGVEVHLGRSAVVESGNVSVLLTTNRPWTHDPNLYRCIGLAPEDANIVVVKSPLMYRTAYASIAKRMLPVDSEGASPSQFVKLPYRNVDPTIFPFDTSRQFTPLAI